MRDLLLRDLKYAFRRLLGEPTFSAVAVGTLALGIGATTAIFSVVDGLLLRDLPYEEPEKLVTVWLDMSRRGGPEREWFTYADFEDFRAEPALFEEMGAWGDWGPTLTGVGQPTVLTGAFVTAGLLDGVLRAEIGQGRWFLPEDDVPGGPDVVVVSDRFWRDRLGSDPAAVGRTLTLNESPFEIVGVLREGFEPPFVPDADLWTTMQFDVSNCGRGCFTIRTVARLEASVTLDRARERASALAQRLAAEYPETNTDLGVSVVELQDDLVRPAARALWVLLGAVGAVLVLACINVANLLLARGAKRRGELAVRSALGAGRSSILRQLLTESLVLSFVGGALGLAVASWGTDLLLRMAPPVAFPNIDSVGVDGRVLVFAIVLTLGTGLLFGLVPAIRVSRGGLYEGVRGVGRGGGEARFRRGVVVVQMGLALILLVGSGLLIRSFQRLTDADLGFDPEGVLTVSVALPQTRYAEGPDRVGFYEGLLDRLEAVPGVTAAGGTNSIPLAGNDADVDFRVEGAPPPGPTDSQAAWVRRITRGYFETMGIELLAGREFAPTDDAEAPEVVIVNEALARRHLDYPARSAIGRRVTFGSGDDPVWRTIVGVAPDTRHFGIRDGTRPAMYFPYAQVPSFAMTIVLRSGGDPTALVGPARAAISSLDPALAASDVQPLTGLVQSAVSVDRFVTVLLGIFAALALVLASVGLYGVVSFGVSRRSREIGIRLALGAERRDVLRLVVLGGLALAAAGVVLGLLGSLALTGVLEALLFEVPVTDPGILLGMAVLLTAVALIASWIPAYRASRSDPVDVLRVE